MTRAILLLLLLLALSLRLVGIDHSLPHRYVPDTHVIRGALGMAQERDLAPPAGRYTSYPYLMPYLLLPEYALLYGVGRATGRWSGPDDFAGQMVDDPTPLYRIARGLVVLFGLLGVYLAWRVGKVSFGKRAGLIAAYLVATSFLMLHLGKSARPWVPVSAMALFTADRALAWLRQPSWKRAAGMGIAAALAASCHQAGGLAVLVVASAVAALIARAPANAIRGAAASAAVFVVLALLVGFPYLLRGHTADVGVDAVGGENAVNFGGQGLALDKFGLGRVEEVGLGFLSAEPAIVLLSLLALFGIRRRKGARASWLVLAVYPMVVVAMFLFYEGAHVRYLSPAVPFLAVIGASAASRLMKRFPGRIPALVILAIPLVQGVRLDVVMSREDTRTEFLRTVAALVPEGSRIAVEIYGPPLRFDEEAVSIVRAAGREVARSEEREAAGLTPLTADRPPYTVIPLERFYEFQSVWPHQYGLPGDTERPEKDIEDFLDEMRIEYVLMVDRHPGGPRNSALDDVMRRRGEKVASLDPFRGAPPCEALLPMDPERPLLAVWRVERPGPSLTLWRLLPRGGSR